MPPRAADAEPAAVALARTAMARGVDALTANDPALARRWLDRALRLAPRDPNAALTLASVCLALEPERSETLFADVAARHDVRQAWLGLAAARLRLSGWQAAAEPLAKVLSRHAFNDDAKAIAARVGIALGWCGLRSDGALEIHGALPGPIEITLDNEPVEGSVLPRDWPTARWVGVSQGGMHLLGSPIEIGTIRRLAGCVECAAGSLRGWAWHPNDPDTAPVLTFSGGIDKVIVARDLAAIPDTGPLARPRSFQLSREELLGTTGPVHVRGPDGKDLPGSPLDPSADERAYVAAALRLAQDYPAGPNPNGDDRAKASPVRARRAVSPSLRADFPVPVTPIGAKTGRRAVTVVIPMHDGGPAILTCLESVVETVSSPSRILVIDDGSADAALIATLDRLARQRTISLVRHARPLGFPASANAGIRAAKGRDVVLLNSDTFVPTGWLERLRNAAYSAPDIATVTPLSNAASILSYPGPAGTNPVPDRASTNRLDRMAERANGATTVDIPVGVGFCLYLRRDGLDATGTFRADLFAQGYGEENDLCLRARRLGWRHVALPGLFVGHVGGASFGDTAMHLQRRNARIVEELHPGYQALVDRYIAADPLAAARRRIDLLAWKQRDKAWRQAAVLITHNDGGGVEQRLLRSAETHAAAGRRPILLRPAEKTGPAESPNPNGEAAIAVRDGIADDLPNLIFAVPRELPALLRLLRSSKATSVEAHHLADHTSSIYQLIDQLAVPYEVHVHDYAWICPRVSLVAAHNRYCGEPDLRDCEACVSDNGHFLKEDISVGALRVRSARFLAAASRVVVPADDTGIRMRRHLSDLSTATVPHEDDFATLPLAPGGLVTHNNRTSAKGKKRTSVCIVGAIGVHKGFEVLLACARDSAVRDMDLDFIVVGHTIDDARLMDTGRVFVTGRFDPDEAVSLIVSQQACFGFVPSICPETWCLSLGDLWRAGLQAAAFDIGGPAERIRKTGRGIVLPLGLSASATNNTLVAAIRSAGH